MFWNTGCTSPLAPYCTPTGSGRSCNRCHPDKTEYQFCDCPANQFCDPDKYSSTYASCIDFPLGRASCTESEHCPVLVTSSSGGSATVGYWPCVGGYCRTCNQSALGNATIVCPGGSPYPGSSHPGETRKCGADGYWIAGGTIDPSLSNPTGTAVPSSPSPSTTATVTATTTASSGGGASGIERMMVSATTMAIAMAVAVLAADI